MNKDGSLGRFSSALDGEQLKTVLAYSKRLIATMGEELLSGRVEAAPNRKNKSPAAGAPTARCAARSLTRRTWSRTRPPPRRRCSKWRKLWGKEEIAMAEMRWTDSQQDAISARRGTVLVAAAAGRGKTAVLVQRALNGSPTR